MNLYKTLLPKYVVEMMTVLIITGQLNAIFHREPHAVINSLILLLIFVIGTIVAEKYQPFILYFFVPVFFILFFLTGNYLFSALFLSVIAVYRFDRLYMDRTRDLRQQALAVSLIVVLLAQFIRTGIVAEELYVFFSLMFLLQLILYFVLKLLTHMTDENISKSSYLKTGGKVLGVLLGLGLVIAFIFKVASLVIKFILIGLLSGLLFLFRPLLIWMDKLEFSTPDFTEEESNEELLNETVKNLLENQQEYNFLENVPVEAIVITSVILLISVVIVILIIRSRRDEIYEEERDKTSFITRINEDVAKVFTKEEREDKVRQVYFEFEQWIRKQGIGRYEDETIEEWLERTHLEEVFNERELAIYSAVRYNHHTYKDVTTFKAHINDVKRRILKILKEREELE